MSHSEQSDTPAPRPGSVLLKAKHLEGVLFFQDSSKAHNPSLPFRSRTTSTLQHVAGNRTPPPVLPKPRLDKPGKGGLTQNCVEPIARKSPADGLLQSPLKILMKPSKSSIALSSAQTEVTQPVSGNLSLATAKLKSDKERLQLTQRNGHSKSHTRTSASLQSPPKLPPKPTTTTIVSRFPTKENMKFSSQAKSTGDCKKKSLAHVAGKGIRKLFHKIKPRDLMRSLLGKQLTYLLFVLQLCTKVLVLQHLTQAFRSGFCGEKNSRTKPKFNVTDATMHVLVP